MKPAFVAPLLILSFSCISVHGVKLPFQRRLAHGVQLSTSTGGSSISLGNNQNIRYSTNITVNGVEVPVLLDTGSTDLWVMPPGGVGQFKETGILLDLSYGDATYGANGTIGIAPVQFGPYLVEQQAFLNASSENIVNVDSLGLHGLLGLGFDLSLVSPINNAVRNNYGENANWGQSVLRNIFEQNPTEPNFIAFALSRTEDLEETNGGSLSVGEVDPTYASIANMPALFQQSPAGGRWTIPLEGIFIDNAPVNVQSVTPGVPPGQLEVLLDTGDPASTSSSAIGEAIFSSIPGAAAFTGSNGLRQWAIPCNMTSILDFKFGGEHYPVHPLDLSSISQFSVDGKNYISCLSRFTAADPSANGYDLALGDTFLRNVYSVFDFGAPLSDGSISAPFIKLLSTLNPSQAISEVSTVRASAMASLAVEMDPATYAESSKNNRIFPAITESTSSLTSSLNKPSSTSTNAPSSTAAHSNAASKIGGKSLSEVLFLWSIFLLYTLYSGY